jgi:hypothetical protein
LAKVAVLLGRDTETTDDKGRFEFKKLTPGSYTLQAQSTDAHPPQTSGGDRIEYVPTWFPSGIDQEQAEPITIRSGANLSGFEIHLKTSPVYRVRGVVLGENGKPETRAMVYSTSAQAQSRNFTRFDSGLFGRGLISAQHGFFMLSRSSAVPLFSGAGQSTPDGTFDLPAVPRGSRLFTAAIQPASGVPIPVTASTSLVVDHDLEDVQIRFSPPFNLEISIEIEGASPETTAGLLRQAMVNLGGIGPGSTAIPGGFRFNNVAAGSYQFGAAPGLPGGYYLASITLVTKKCWGNP